MKKLNYNIVLNLNDNLPDDFSISYDELQDFYLNKYKAHAIEKENQLHLNFQSFNQIEIIRNDPRFIAGRFSIEVENDDNIKQIPVDFMIAKHVKEKTKNKSMFRTPYFEKLDKKQVDRIHKIFVDGIMPKCLEKIRIHTEFLRQKKLHKSE